MNPNFKRSCSFAFALVAVKLPFLTMKPTIKRVLTELGKKAPFPNPIEPMLATLNKEPFDDSDWLYEVKWDGYRILAYVKDHQVVLLSRSQLNYTAKYPPVVKALSMLPDCV